MQLKETYRDIFKAIGWSTESFHPLCLQKIADVAEKLSDRFESMQSELNRLYNRLQESHVRNAAQERRINSLRGVITRQKKEIERLKGGRE